MSVHEEGIMKRLVLVLGSLALFLTLGLPQWAQACPS